MNVSQQIDNFIELNTKRESGSWEWRTRDALNIALARLDAAEAHAAQLEAERDAWHLTADKKEMDLQIVISQRDEARRERDALQAKLEQAQATAKSNGEMWAQADSMYKQTVNERLEDANTILALRGNLEYVQAERDALTAEVERMQTVIDDLDGFSGSFAAMTLTNKNVGIRHTEYEGEYESETPFGQQLDGLGDEVEP